MYPVTATYKEDINNSVRNPSYINIIFGLINPFAPYGSTLTDDGHLPYSNVASCDLGLSVASTYATMEHNHFILNGLGMIPRVLAPLFQGYVGDLISGADCLWSTDPVISITFDELFDFSGLTFKFDPTTGGYASEMVVKAWNGITEVMNVTMYPTSYIHQYLTPVPLCDSMEITFKKSSTPYRRCRLTSLVYGLVQVLSDSDIVSANSLMEVDMLSSKLPKANFDFTILDTEQAYNPENPTGIWSYLEQRQPVSALIGYELDSGIIEWIPWANNYSTGEITTESTGVATRVTIKTVGLIHHLNQTYDEGVYDGTGATSLADLVRTLMTFVGFDGAVDLDVSLETIYTYTPLPVDKVNNLLQIIANAGQCILGISRGGVINFTVRDVTVDTFSLNLGKQITAPKTIKYPVLRNLTTLYNNLVVEASSKTLVAVDISGASATDITITHQCATNHGNTVDGTLVVNSITYYAYKTVANVSGTGKLSITGKEIVFNDLKYTEQYSLAGEDLEVKNPLITSYADAVSYTTWVAGVMNKQTEYETEHRGYPELDPVDNIIFTSGYTEDFPVTVIKNEITYNGAIRGKGKFLIGGDV